MVVFAHGVGLAGHPAHGQMGQRAAGRVHQRHVLDAPVLHVPRPVGKLGVLPVGVIVDVVEAGLNVNRAETKLRAANQRPDVQLVLEEGVHRLPVGVLRVPEEIAEVAAGRRGSLPAAECGNRVVLDFQAKVHGRSGGPRRAELVGVTVFLCSQAFHRLRNVVA